MAPPSTFQHEALLYEGLDGFLASAVPFLREGLEAGEPAMVAVAADKVERLRGALGADAGQVRFVDMGQLGRNPGRIISAWLDFVGDEAVPGRPARGIGEPIWPGRTPAELVECQLHESLLNLAFAEADGFRLLCPYDTAALEPGVVHEACCSHPLLMEAGERRDSHEYRGADVLLAPFDAPLPKPGAHGEVFGFDREGLREVRTLAGGLADAAGLAEARKSDFVLAVSEVAANSVHHGGGNGILRVWREDDALLCEVRDRGRITDPLVGRQRPPIDQTGGWGMWIAHQLCDLVQVRSDAAGTVVRMVVRVP